MPIGFVLRRTIEMLNATLVAPPIAAPTSTGISADGREGVSTTPAVAIPMLIR